MAADTITVVIIDDNPVDRETCRRYLAQASSKYVVHEAADGKSGLELVQRVGADCVLLDLRLSEESGFEVLDALVQGGKRDIPVIMLTGARWGPLRTGAKGLGAKGYLIKDEIDPATLDKAIQAAIAG